MMTALYAFFTYALLFFIARFACLNGLFVVFGGKMGRGGNVGFYVMEGYWVGVAVNHSSQQ